MWTHPRSEIAVQINIAADEPTTHRTRREARARDSVCVTSRVGGCALREGCDVLSCWRSCSDARSAPASSSIWCVNGVCVWFAQTTTLLPPHTCFNHIDFVAVLKVTPMLQFKVNWLARLDCCYLVILIISTIRYGTPKRISAIT